MNNNFVAKALRLTLAVALAGTLAPPRAQSESRERPVASYILALSWSPTYCETDRRREDQPQCSGRRRYAFILHGLWPQWARGWPEFCPSAQGKYVPEKIVRSMLDIMPARGLVIHQYRKHGTCSGLSPSAYFDRARTLSRHQNSSTLCRAPRSYLCDAKADPGGFSRRQSIACRLT